MIKNIPTESEFERSGVLFLNLAWDIVSDLYFKALTFEEWDLELDDSGEDKTLENMVWDKSSHFLSNSLVLVQQGLEFLLKARIAGISPYLLISNLPRDWPKSSSKTDTSFAKFRTVDAQDLVRINDTVTSTLLSSSFKRLIETIRQSRNSVMHTVGNAASPKPDEIWKWILEILINLRCKDNWLNFRKSYLSDGADALMNIDFVEGKAVWEGMQLLRILTASERKKYLGVSKTRRYICTQCTHSYQEYYHSCKNIKSAQLDPNILTSIKLKCFICDSSVLVKRHNCLNAECPGNVIDAEKSLCLTCGSRSYDSD